MFKTLKNALKTPDVRRRLLYTLLLIVVFRLGCYITVPGVDSIALNEAMGNTEGIAGLIDIISGGAFSRFSVFAMSRHFNILTGLILINPLSSESEFSFFCRILKDSVSQNQISVWLCS